MEDVTFRSPKKRGRVAVFLSGRGTNFNALCESMNRGDVNADIALVLSNRPDAPGLLKAREMELDTVFLDPKPFASKEEYDQTVRREVEKRDIDLICLAGYMKILTREFCDAFKYRIMNIHPALLPAFPGVHVHQKAIDWGVRVSGCTVHFVTSEVDMGPIILQAAVPLLQEDTADDLADRILVEEHRIYPQAVRFYFEGWLEVRGRRVFILEPTP